MQEIACRRIFRETTAFPVESFCCLFTNFKKDLTIKSDIFVWWKCGGDEMATIKDVAKKAKLGTSTVSRYFNKSGYVSEESRMAIEQACAELQYTPNALARAVKTKKSYTICLIVPNISYYFFAELSAVIQRACIQRGYKVLLMNASDESIMKEINRNQLNHGLVDGAIIASVYEHVETLCYDVPVVFLEKVSSVSQHQKYSCIYADQEDGMHMGMQYLREKGCQKILYLASASLYRSAMERKQAYAAFMHQYALPTCIMTLEELQETGYSYLTQNGFDGVIAWNDYTAAIFMDHCREAGIRIPEDIQLVGFDNVSLAQYLYPQLTTIEQPIESLGTYAVDTLINKIEGKQKEEIKVILNCHLIERKTTK